MLLHEFHFPLSFSFFSESRGRLVGSGCGDTEPVPRVPHVLERRHCAVERVLGNRAAAVWLQPGEFIQKQLTRTECIKTGD